MPELRVNPLCGQWVVVAPERAARPRQVRSPAPGVGPSLPRHDPGCPLCPGNESELPGILWERPGQGGWSVRSVPNRFPALGQGPEPPAPARPAPGDQEVLIESPRHDLDLPDLTDEGLRTVIEAYHARYRALSSNGQDARIFLFRNHGPAAGTSLAHPHAQLVATPLDPPAVRARERRQREHRERVGECLVCSLASPGGDGDEREVARGWGFRAVVPWAARGPFEVWILPEYHRADFGELDAAGIAGLAAILGSVLRAFRERAGDPSYNLLVHSARRRDRNSLALHWFVELRPRVATMAGLELGSGLAVNPSSPEADAARLRGGG